MAEIILVIGELGKWTCFDENKTSVIQIKCSVSTFTIFLLFPLFSWFFLNEIRQHSQRMFAIKRNMVCFSTDIVLTLRKPFWCLNFRLWRREWMGFEMKFLYWQHLRTFLKAPYMKSLKKSWCSWKYTNFMKLLQEKRKRELIFVTSFLNEPTIAKKNFKWTLCGWKKCQIKCDFR